MKAYVINLDRSPERLVLFHERAAQAGLAFERIPAVDGRALSKADLDAVVSPNHTFQPISESEAAVFLSHRACWQKLIDSSDGMIAVFEDDAVLADGIVDLLAAIEELGPSFGICHLETTGRSVVIEKPGIVLGAGFSLHRQLTWHGGAAGYVITRPAAQLLLSRFQRIADPVDQVMFHPGSDVFSALDVRQIVPGAVIQHAFLLGTVGKPELASTIIRPKKKGRLFRHGLWGDLKLAWIRHLERRLRNRLATEPANQRRTIPFADWSGQS